MGESQLTEERILEAAEEVLRRFGPSKATVVDVARALDVSHGSVYRFFPSKAALRDAVARRWLKRITDELEVVAISDKPPLERVYLWLKTLISLKQTRALSDHELFMTYLTIAEEAREVIQKHVDHMIDQLARILEEGHQAGVLEAPDPQETASVILGASAKPNLQPDSA